MLVKKIFISLYIVLFTANNLIGQIYLNQIHQENPFNIPQENHLIMAEFWATWCVPCIYASKKLAVLQDEFKDDLYIYSISGESSEMIKKYIFKHNPLLTIASDFDNKTSTTFNLQKSIPYAIILNQKNDIVWSGNPVEIDSKIINKLISENKNTKPLPLNKRVYISSYEFEKTEWENNTFELIKINTTAEAKVSNNNGVLYKGLVSDLLSDFLHIDKKLLIVEDDFFVDAKISNAIFNNCDIDYKLSILSKIFEIDTTFKELKFYEATYQDSELFWNTNVINWDDSPNLSIESEFDLTISNANIYQLSVYLGKYLNAPVEFKQNNCNLYDWQFPYKYSNLMFDELTYTFGITLEEKTKEIKTYQFSSKK